MKSAYSLYCRFATVVFIINTVYPVTTKLLQERLAEDWLHSVLHLCSALFGIYAGWYASNIAPAKVFTWGIGVLYSVLGLYGWFTPGFLLHTPLAIPIGGADNVFHLLLSVPALVIMFLDIRTLLSAGSTKAAPSLTQEKLSRLSKKIGSWPFGGVGLVTIGIALLAAPAQFEGPVLIPISPGHALSVLDSVALIPLLAGLAWLYWGVWLRRYRIYDATRTSPGKGGLGVFAAGLGVGLLLASAFSTFWWWWAIGATLFLAMTIIAVLAAETRS